MRRVTVSWPGLIRAGSQSSRNMSHVPIWWPWLPQSRWSWPGSSPGWCSGQGWGAAGSWPSRSRTPRCWPRLSARSLAGSGGSGTRLHPRPRGSRLAPSPGPIKEKHRYYEWPLTIIGLILFFCGFLFFTSKLCCTMVICRRCVWRNGEGKSSLQWLPWMAGLPLVIIQRGWTQRESENDQKIVAHKYHSALLSGRGLTSLTTAFIFWGHFWFSFSLSAFSFLNLFFWSFLAAWSWVGSTPVCKHLNKTIKPGHLAGLLSPNIYFSKQWHSVTFVGTRKPAF